MNAKTKTKTTMYKWTACNPYSYLNGVVEARTLLGAGISGARRVPGICRGQVLHYSDPKSTPLMPVIWHTQR